MKVFNKKRKLGAPLIQSCKYSSDYLIDNDSATKNANKKVDEGFVDDLLKTQDKYLEVIQATNTVLSNLAHWKKL